MLTWKTTMPGGTERKTGYIRRSTCETERVPAERFAQLAGKKRVGKRIRRIKQDGAKHVAAPMRQRLLNQH